MNKNHPNEKKQRLLIQCLLVARESATITCDLVQRQKGGKASQGRKEWLQACTEEGCSVSHKLVIFQNKLQLFYAKKPNQHWLGRQNHMMGLWSQKITWCHVWGCGLQTSSEKASRKIQISEQREFAWKQLSSSLSQTLCL